MGKDEIMFWRSLSHRYNGPVGPRIQWGIEPLEGYRSHVYWFGTEVPEACYAAAIPLPPLSHRSVDPDSSLKEEWERIFQETQK